MGLVREIFGFSGGFLRYSFFSKFIRVYPRGMIINLTYKCNSKCIMCNIWKVKPKKELVYKDWKKIFKDDIFKKIREVTISGGEAFLCRDYVEIVKLMIDSVPKLKKIVMNTNGFADNVAGDVLELAEYCRIKGKELTVTVSIDDVGVRHDLIRKIEGGFDRAIKTIETIQKESGCTNKFNLNVASVLMGKNIGKYKEIRDWFGEKKVNHSFQLVGFHETYVNNLDRESELDFRGPKKKRLLNFLIKEAYGGGLTEFYWNDMYRMYKYGSRRETPCPFLVDNLAIDGYGDVYYCLSTKPIGNFLKEGRTIKEIYFDKKNLRIRRSLWNRECKYCNSGCDAGRSVAYDFSKYFTFKLKRIISGIFQ